MKIRHGFVTNSSSSSFILLIKIEKTDGKIIEFKGNGGSPECGRIDYFDCDAKISVSPRQLGKAKDVEKMIKLLTDGVIDDTWDWQRKIFEAPASEEEFDEDIHGAYWFIEEIRENIKSMDEIAKIYIAGEEYNYVDYIRRFLYDRQKDEYTGIIIGEDFEKDGSSGGDMCISDMRYCKFISEGED